MSLYIYKNLKHQCLVLVLPLIINTINRLLQYKHHKLSLHGKWRMPLCSATITYLFLEDFSPIAIKKKNSIVAVSLSSPTAVGPSHLIVNHFSMSARDSHNILKKYDHRRSLSLITIDVIGVTFFGRAKILQRS